MYQFANYSRENKVDCKKETIRMDDHHIHSAVKVKLSENGGENHHLL